MKNLVSVLAGAFSILVVSGAHASEPAASHDVIDVAERYLAAYSTFDPEKMAPFYADDAVFSDPTSTTQNAEGGPFIFEGKEAILKGLGDYAAQYKSFSVSYDVERRYESNGVVVFVSTLSYVAVTNDDQTYTGAAPIVTAVEVRDGKVARHTDYYDYAGNAVNMSD